MIALPKKVNKKEQYPFQVELHVTRVRTREGNGVIISRQGEWIQVLLPTRNKIIETSLFLVDEVS
ncbi:hypothetical protein [Paenibacillus sp. 598K]|uniref:hypothetical protein n=1 Tax=Paenibacillus sp. 598K TaxID=1117987 RepID=UPI000FFF2CA9|nr:hypothetical protein [Paenibacillus sp. 598K]